MSYLTSGVLYVVIGAIAIAVGGVFTTLGWSQLNNHSQKKTLVFAATKEWEQNGVNLLTIETFLARDENLENPMLISTFNSFAQNAILTSHLIGDKEKSLRDVIADYMTSVTTANDSIKKINNIVSGKATPTKRREVYKNFYSSPLFGKLKRKHQEVGKALKAIN